MQTNAWRDANLRVLWPRGGLDTNGWAWGSYHGYRNPKKRPPWNLDAPQRIIDGCVAFDVGKAIRVDEARLLVPDFVGAIYKDETETINHALTGATNYVVAPEVGSDAPVECASRGPPQPADHFAVVTDLTLKYLDAADPAESLSDSSKAEWTSCRPATVRARYAP